MPPSSGTAPILSFLGAAGTVTGSRFLIEASEATVLVDCGLFQGLKAHRLRNWEPFPVDPALIDAVVVTHAHIDHIGYLPRLCSSGFRGPVWCSTGTADLAAIVLPDSGHLHEEEAAFASRMGYSKHRPALPLYTEAEAIESLRQLRPVDFGTRVEIARGVSIELRPAGHILGSSLVRVELTDHGRTIVFSGDLGRPDHPILLPPPPPDDADIVVMESTYGGRSHDDAGAMERFADAIVRTAGRGGTVVIPAFAVDRTEVVLLRLRELTESGSIPRLPTHVDSPMALRALRVYREAIVAGTADVRPELTALADPFDAGQLHEVTTIEGSKSLAQQHHPAIIVSASGMATGGRVLHHLARLLPDHRNTVVLVGFQAEGTRGRSLADGAREVKMLGRHVPVRAEIVDLPAFSVHADHGELVSWISSGSPTPEAVYLVHGEPTASAALCNAIDDAVDVTTVVPRHGERVLIT